MFTFSRKSLDFDTLELLQVETEETRTDFLSQCIQANTEKSREKSENV